MILSFYFCVKQFYSFTLEKAQLIYFLFLHETIIDFLFNTRRL